MKYKLRQVRSFAIDNAKEDNTFISMSLSSETPVLRSFGNEILLHNVDNIDMSRTMPNGLPLLINHDDTTLPVGRLKNIRLDSDTKKLRGDAYFSGRADAQSVRQDILDGIISDVSIGYRILDYKVRKAELEDTPNDFLVTKWQPYEGSLVGLPADNSVGVGRADTEDEEDEKYGNSNTQCAFPTTKVKIDRTEYVSDLSMNDTKVFETLDPDEKKYLPLNYIVSSLMEWKFVQEACASGFRSVANLSRVSNKTIREIANISQHTLDKKTAMIPKLNQAFIDYAAQRGI